MAELSVQPIEEEEEEAPRTPPDKPIVKEPVEAEPVVEEPVEAEEDLSELAIFGSIDDLEIFNVPSEEVGTDTPTHDGSDAVTSFVVASAAETFPEGSPANETSIKQQDETTQLAGITDEVVAAATRENSIGDKIAAMKAANREPEPSTTGLRSTKVAFPGMTDEQTQYVADGTDAALRVQYSEDTTKNIMWPTSESYEVAVKEPDDGAAALAKVMKNAAEETAEPYNPTIKNNNPGNIRFSKENDWEGAVPGPSKNNFARFKTLDAGLRAIAVTTDTYRGKHGIDTVDAYIKRYAPYRDEKGKIENPNQADYIDFVSKRLRVRATDEVDFTDPDIVFKLMRGIIGFEREKDDPAISDSQVAKAVVAAGYPPVSKSLIVNDFPTVADAPRIVDEWDEVGSVNDFLKYINLGEVEGSMDLDVGLMVENMILEQEMGPQFHESMRSKYGPEYQARLIAYAVREVGVDVGLLVGAAFNPTLAPLVALKAAQKAGKAVTVGLLVGQAINRAIIVALGGGTIAANLNIVTDQDAEFGKEIYARFVGELGGEVVSTLGSLGIKGVKSTIRKVRGDVKKELDVDVFTEDMQTTLVKPDGTYTSSLAKLYVEAVLFRYSNRFAIMKQKIAKGVASDDITDPLRIAVSELTKIPEDQIDLGMVLAPQHFKKFKKLLKPRLDLDTGKPVLDVDSTVKSVFATKREIMGDKAAAKLTKNAKSRINTAAATLSAKQTALATARDLARRATTRPNKESFKGEARGLKAEIKDIKAKIKRDQNEIDELDFKTSTGAPIIDQILMGEGFGDRAMSTLMAKTKLNNRMIVNTFNNSEWSPHNAYPTGEPIDRNALEAFTFNIKLRHLLADPEMFVGQAATDQLFALNKAEASIKVFDTALRNSLHGLNKNSQENVWRVLQEGNDDAVVFGEDMILSKLTAEEAAGYYAIRSLLEQSHMIFDNVMVREFTARTLEDGSRAVMRMGERIVNVSNTEGVRLTKSMIDDGFVEVTEVPTKNTQKLFTDIVKRGELDPELVSVVPYEVGYIPRIYKNAKFYVGAINTKTGAYRRVAAFTNRADNQKFLNDALERNEEASFKLEKDEIAFQGEWDEFFQRGSLGFSSRSVDLLDAAPAGAVKALREALDNAGQSESEVKVMLDKLSGADLRRAFTGARGEVLQGNAKVLGAREATVDYLQAVSVKNGVSDWRRHTVNWFHEAYDSVLDGKWYDENPFKDYGSLTPEAKKLHRAGRQVHLWMRRTIFQETSLERTISKWMKNTADAWEGTPIMGQLTKLIDASPRQREWINVARGIPASAKLLFGNVGQIVVQGTQVIATLGSRPIHGAKGMMDVMDVVRANSAEFMGATINNKETRQSLYALRRAGWAANLDTTDIYDISKNGLGTIGTATGYIHKGPFRIGEGFNRLVAFYTTRREFISLMKAGKEFPNGEVFKGKVDSDEFLEHVVTKAKVTALDMGKAGQLKLFSGWGSVVFQFMQVAPKMLNMFESKQLTVGQKFGAASAMLAAWGPLAIPFIPDVIGVVIDPALNILPGTKPSERDPVSTALNNAVRDSARVGAEWVSKMTRPEIAKFVPDWILDRIDNEEGVENFLRRLGTKGFINAASKGEIDLVNRIAVGRMITDAASNAQWTDAIIMISVLKDYSEAVGLLVDTVVEGRFSAMNPITISDAFGQWQRGESTYAASFEDYFGKRPAKLSMQFMKELGQGISYLGHVSKMLEVADREFWDENFNSDLRQNTFRTSGNMNTGVVATFGRGFSEALGVTPGLVKKQFDAQRLEAHMNEAWTEYKNKKFEEYGKASAKAQQVILHDVVQEGIQMRQLFDSRNLKGNLSKNFYSDIIESFISRILKQELGDPREQDPFKL